MLLIRFVFVENRGRGEGSPGWSKQQSVFDALKIILFYRRFIFALLIGDRFCYCLSSLFLETVGEGEVIKGGGKDNKLFCFRK